MKKKKTSYGSMFKRELGNIKKIKKKAKSEDIKFLRQRIASMTNPKKIRELEYKRDKTKKELKKKLTSARIGAVSGYVERTTDRVEKAVAKALKQKILKKPSIRLEKPISTKKLIKSFANAGYRTFAREPKDYSEQPIQDKRNLFFN